jgi:hypothetical protein
MLLLGHGKQIQEAGKRGVWNKKQQIKFMSANGAKSDALRSEQVALGGEDMTMQQRELVAQGETGGTINCKSSGVVGCCAGCRTEKEKRGRCRELNRKRESVGPTKDLAVRYFTRLLWPQRLLLFSNAFTKHMNA